MLVLYMQMLCVLLACAVVVVADTEYADAVCVVDMCCCCSC